MAFNNFTVNIVSFDETAGVDWTMDNPSVVLTLTPDPGYSISAFNFAPTSPLPTYVSSVTFTQNGSNIDCVINYTVPSVMPSADVLISLCATGYAEAITISVSGTIKDCGITNTKIPKVGNLPISYSGSGDWNTTSTVFTQAVEASTGFFFQTEPILALSIGIASDYTITSIKTYNLNNQLTQIVFTVTYTFPVATVTGDEFCLIANAISIYNPAVKITSYKFNLTSIFAGSITRSFVINGIEGANWALQCNYTPGNINIVNTSGVIGVDGLSVVTVIFPASAVNRTYTFALTGDLAANFDTSLGQTSTPIVYQYVQSTLGFQFSSTNASITVGAAATRNYLPTTQNQNNQFVITASSTSDFVLVSTPPSGNWSNQALANQPADYDLSVLSQAFVINNTPAAKTLTATIQVNVGFAGVNNLTSILDLDNFVQGTLVPLKLQFGSTNTIACCSGVSGNFFVAAGQTFLTASSILDASGNPAADGFYRQ